MQTHCLCISDLDFDSSLVHAFLPRSLIQYRIQCSMYNIELCDLDMSRVEISLADRERELVIVTLTNRHTTGLNSVRFAYFFEALLTDVHYSNKSLIGRDSIGSLHNCTRSRRQDLKGDYWLHPDNI